MTRILLLTAALIAAMSISAFAVEDDDTVDVSVTISNYFTIDTTGSASEAIDDSDYPQNPGDGDTTVVIDDTVASANFSANTAFEINPSCSEQFGTTVLETQFGSGAWVAADGTGNEVHSGIAINNGSETIGFRLTGVNGASLPQSENNEVVTVTFTIGVDV